jgi:hypothetical protein
MEFGWYYPNSSGGGGGTVIVEGSDYQTLTLPVTSSMRGTTASIMADEDSLGYNVEAYEYVNGAERPIEVTYSVLFLNGNAEFAISWEPPFKGYININYWTKTNI